MGGSVSAAVPVLPLYFDSIAAPTGEVGPSLALSPWSILLPTVCGLPRILGTVRAKVADLWRYAGALYVSRDGL